MVIAKSNSDFNFSSDQTYLSSTQVILLPGKWCDNKHHTWHAKIRPDHILTILWNSPKPWLYHGGAEPTLKSLCKRQGMCAGLCSVSLEQGMPTYNTLHRQTSRGETCTSQLNLPRTTISSTKTSWQGTAHGQTIKLSCSVWQHAPKLECLLGMVSGLCWLPNVSRNCLGEC